MSKKYGAQFSRLKSWMIIPALSLYATNAAAIDQMDVLVENVTNGAMVRTLKISSNARYYNSHNHGLGFGGSVHALGSDAASFVIRGDYVFVPYYHEDFSVRLVRKSLKTGTSTEIAFLESKVPCGGVARRQDTHHNFAFQISEDGAMHLFFGHHKSRLRYLKSVSGAADVTDANFSETLFTPPTRHQISTMVRSDQDRHCNGVETLEWPFLNEADGVLSNITYPRLSNTENGLTLFFRQGSTPRKSNLYAARYLGGGNWSERFRIIDGFQGGRELPDGTISSSRGPYTAASNGQRSAHISWTYREADNRPHGIYYARSQDGKTWTSNSGKVLAKDRRGFHNDMSINIQRPFTVVDPDITGVFMFINVTEDRHQNPHITSYRFAGRVYGSNFWELYHYTPVESAWQKTKVGTFTGGQPMVIPDPQSDDLFMVMNDYESGFLRIQRATKSDNWQSWTPVYQGSPGYVSHGYSEIDNGRLIVAAQQEIQYVEDDSSSYDLLLFQLSELRDPI